MTTPRLLSYDISDRVTAFSTTRHGGVSKGSHAQFNINYYCGDAPEAIEANRKALCSLLGIDKTHLVYPHQTHGVEIRQIAPEFFPLEEETQKMLLEGVDAVMTDMTNVCIGVSTADCIPMILYDPEHHASCAVHAGWRGTVARIAQNAVRSMNTAYLTHPEKLRAVIGPGISLKNFEVGDEVFQQFSEAGFDIPSIARRFPTLTSPTPDTHHPTPEKWHIDLWECNRQQLIAAGVRPENIQAAGICTYDNVEDFFSARRLGIESGRIFTGVILK